MSDTERTIKAIRKRLEHHSERVTPADYYADVTYLLTEIDQIRKIPESVDGEDVIRFIEMLAGSEAGDALIHLLNKLDGDKVDKDLRITELEGKLKSLFDLLRDFPEEAGCFCESLDDRCALCRIDETLEKNSDPAAGSEGSF